MMGCGDECARVVWGEVVRLARWCATRREVLGTWSPEIRVEYGETRCKTVVFAEGLGVRESRR